jgi:hypothetical protein
MHASWTSARPLVDLALRRALAPAILIGYAALAALLASRDWAPATAMLGARGAGEQVAIAHGLVRQGIWSGACIALIPFLVLRSASTVSAWRRGEVDWLGSRAATRTTVLAWTWLGAFAAAAIVVAAIALTAEARIANATPGFRYAGELGPPGSGWVEGRRALEWQCADPGARAAPGTRMRLALVLAVGSAPGAEIVLEAHRAPRTNASVRDGAAGASARGKAAGASVAVEAAGASAPTHARAVQRIGTRGAIEIELPRGDGDLAFSLSCAHDGERAYALSTRGELWTPVASDRAAGVALFARACSAVAAWTALAIGLGAWMHAASATLFLLALMLPAWMATDPPSFVPGGDLFAALAIVGEGRVPPALDPRVLLTSAAAVAVGLALARWSLASWRREP